jgi:drug/metabolite transporter (DMT)-like permease
VVALPAEVYDLLWRIFGTPQVWMAIGCMLTFLVLWMISLSWADLTFVMPLTALTYVLNAILVGPVLGEHVSPTRWVGTVLIALGVALVTLERAPETTQPAPAADS